MNGDEAVRPMNDLRPPNRRYRLTLTIEGNTLDEVQDVVNAYARLGFLNDSDCGRRDAWYVTHTRCESLMTVVDPGMTPDRYFAELDAWFKERSVTRFDFPALGTDHTLEDQ